MEILSIFNFKYEKMARLRLIIFFAALFTIILCFGVPAKVPLIERNGELLPKCTVGFREIEDLRQELIRSKAEIILLGNSMVGEGVHQGELTRQLNRKALTVWVGGGSSAWWYLVIKNIIAPSPAKPEHLLIFFRDNFLTLPHYRTKGKYVSYIDNFAGKEELVLDRILYFNDSNHYSLILKSHIPFYRNSQDYNDKFKAGLKELSSKILGIGKADALEKAINNLFHENLFSQRLGHLAQIQEDKYLEDKMNYNFFPENTFLPHIIRICKENDIGLTFVRVKRRRDTEPNRQANELVQYIEKLTKYLNMHQVQLFDYTKNTSIKPEHYGKGDHLNDEIGRILFTKILSKDMETLFRRDI